MIKNEIGKLLNEAVKKSFNDELEVQILLPNQKGFGDYSSNVALILGKKLNKNPKEIAEQIISDFPKNELIEKIEIAGPGFINFFIKSEEIAKEIFNFNPLEKLDYLKDKKIVLDFSHPNIAKPLHFGHFRSTVIGESLVRILRYAGAEVLADNYLGDWGTQFGKLVVAIRKWGDQEQIRENPIQELVKLYQKFHEELEKNPELEKEGAEEFRKMEQERNEENLKLWKWIVDVSLEQLNKFYDRLDIHFDVIRGESFWEGKIDNALEVLIKNNVIKKDNGALVAFFEEETKLPPMIFQRSDGASLYQTRDITRIKFYEDEQKWTDLVYVVDEGQSLHFRQLAETAKMLGLNIKITQAAFGFIQDESGKKLSTRKGSAIGVDYVLDEAEEKVAEILKEKNVKEKLQFSDQELDKLKKVIAIGAIKFNDLSQNRIRNIVFNWEKILSFEGFSAPFLQYSYARGKSIIRKVADFKIEEIKELKLSSEHEIVLAKKILHFPEIVKIAAESLRPNMIAEYLFELAADFNKFYANEKVISEDLILQNQRLFLVQKTCELLKHGLYLLGIDVPEKM